MDEWWKRVCERLRAELHPLALGRVVVGQQRSAAIAAHALGQQFDDGNSGRHGPIVGLHHGRLASHLFAFLFEKPNRCDVRCIRPAWSR